MGIKVDLGCGPKSYKHHTRPDGFVGVDCNEHFAPDIVANIAERIPGLDDGCADHVRCSHVLEHLPGETMWRGVAHEILRLLAPGGTFEIRVPHPAYDNVMIVGHLWVFTPHYWRCCQDEEWFGPDFVIDYIEEVRNDDCFHAVRDAGLDWLVLKPFLRNAYTETVVTGHKGC